MQSVWISNVRPIKRGWPANINKKFINNIVKNTVINISENSLNKILALEVNDADWLFWCFKNIIHYWLTRPKFFLNYKS
jgi:hypothetical protein